MNREIITFEDADECSEVAGGYHEDYEQISKEMYDQRRWVTCFEVIVKRKSDGKFFRSQYCQGSTESQDQSPYEYDEKVFTEVFPVEKTVIVYE